MAPRVVNGNTHSENGWPLVDQDSCRWVRVPGAEHVSLLIQDGEPAVVLGAFAGDYHAYVEPLRDDDSGCWTETNDVLGTPGRNNGSNHLGGTAEDLNWNGPDGRTFKLGIPKERAYPGDKSRNLDELLAFYEGMVFCGGEWSIRDWMHFQMGGNTYNNPRTADFIRRKIRPDGKSTFRRGTAPSVNAVSVLAKATGIPESRASEILPDVSEALRLANCTNPRRIAAALAQWVVESGHFVYTEEIASGPENEDRWKYKGRTWIQLTWKTNYLGFSRWCHGLGLVPTDTYFGDHPKELAQLRWRALGPAYWWAVQYPQINEYADRGDIDNVSKWVNAPAWVDNPNKHANGEAARREVYNTALAFGDQLLALVSSSSTPPPEELDEWEALMASNDLYTSRSIYRDSNAKTMRPLDAVFFADAMDHADLVESAAKAGEHWAIEKVALTAAGQGAGAMKWYDQSQPDTWAIQHAQYVLASIERTAPDALRAYLAAKGVSA